MAQHLHKLSALEIAAAIRRRDLSAAEVVDLHLARIAEINPEINAVVTLAADDARAAAAQADRAVQRGAALSPLHGVPFTVKDIIATKGIRTTAGSRTLSDYIPPASATAVKRLQTAGAILIGKTNCPEYALDMNTDNLVFGRTCNPWNPAYTSGGSSGGDSAAVAAGCSAFGVGTDYGGSIRWPAHCTGLASLRPTGSIVPASGQIPYSPLPDADPYDLVPVPPPNSMSLQSQLQRIAPIARRVMDLWPIVNAMAGPDGIDVYAAPVRLGDPREVDVRTLRYSWWPSDGSVPVAPDVARVVEDAALALDRLGFSVRRELPPGLERAEQLFDSFRAAEGVPDHEALAVGREGVLSDNIRGWFAASRTSSVREYRTLAAQRDVLRARIVRYLAERPILLLPVASIAAFVPDPQTFVVEDVELPRLRALSCCRSISMLNLPAAVVPCGTSDDGLPVGVQVVGRPFHDHEVIAVAHRLEELFGPWRPPERRPHALSGAMR